MALVFKEGVKKHYVLLEKLSSSIVFGKGLRKTAARTLSFLSEAVSGENDDRRRRTPPTEKEPLSASTVGEKHSKT